MKSKTEAPGEKPQNAAYFIFHHSAADYNYGLCNHPVDAQNSVSSLFRLRLNDNRSKLITIEPLAYGDHNRLHSRHHVDKLMTLIYLGNFLQQLWFGLVYWKDSFQMMMLLILMICYTGVSGLNLLAFFPLGL